MKWLRENRRELTALDRAEIDLKTLQARRILGDSQASLIVAGDERSTSIQLLLSRVRSARAITDRLAGVVGPWDVAPQSVHSAIADLQAVLS